MCYCTPSIRTPQCGNINCIPRDNYGEWINVHERMPEQGEYVIGYCENYPNNFVSMVRFEASKRCYYFWNDALDREGKVTHWMPLPEPPE